MKANIDKFRGIHPKSSIAILGSSPTIKLYKGEEDISIAVNGVVMCNLPNTPEYYMCGDKESFRRTWFEHSKTKARTRIVATFVAPYDSLVLPNENERSKLQKILDTDEFHMSDKGGNIKFSPDFEEIEEPHGIFKYADIWEEKINPDQKRLCRGGTISGVATQMAMIMGAKEIHLYGCSFGKPPKEEHYAYDNKKEPGGINKNHPIVMDYILSMINLYGIKIYSHGYSNLSIPKKN